MNEVNELNELKELDMPNGKPPNPHPNDPPNGPPNGPPNHAPADNVIKAVAAAAAHVTKIFLIIPISYLRYVLIENILLNISCVFSGKTSGSERLLLLG